jgi:glycosylphosphatidylinositol transamidase (GPIT) subunit GPI8
MRMRRVSRARAEAPHRVRLRLSYGQTIEVDYRGYDVTVENFLRVLTGAAQRRSRRVAS